MGGLDSGSPGSRYRQTLGYDGFGHIASRSTVDDGTSRSFTASYTNNRKTSGGYEGGHDTHDAAGNVVQNTRNSPDTTSWKFDAAGRMTSWPETTRYAGITRWDQGETLIFDGDGRTAKRLKGQRMYASPPSGWNDEPEYYIYSSVTGQKITELEQTGQKKKTNVYMGSTVIAEYTSGGVAFKHTDPVTSSVMQTDPSGEIAQYDVGRVELEALGAVLPTQPPESQEPPHNFGKGGSTVNIETGCELNGAPTACSRVIGYLRGRGYSVLGGEIQSLWRYRKFLIAPGDSSTTTGPIEDDTHLVDEWYEVHSTPLRSPWTSQTQSRPLSTQERLDFDTARDVARDTLRDNARCRNAIAQLLKEEASPRIGGDLTLTDRSGNQTLVQRANDLLYNPFTARSAYLDRYDGITMEASGRSGNADGFTTYGSTTRTFLYDGTPRGNFVSGSVEWNTEFFSLGRNARALHVLHEVIHQFASDIDLANRVAIIEGDNRNGSPRRFANTSEASNYLNRYLSRVCNLPMN